MALEDRVKELEEELKVLKNEIQTTLLDIQEQILSHYYPSLYPSANKEFNLAQAKAAQQAAAVPPQPAPIYTAPAAPTYAPASPQPAAAPTQQPLAPTSRFHGKYQTQTITLVEEADEDETDEADPSQEEKSVRLAVVPKTNHNASKPAVNGRTPSAKLPVPSPEEVAQKLTAEDEAFLDAIVAKERTEPALKIPVSFDEFKDVMQQKAPENTEEENLFTEELLDELLKDSLSAFNEDLLNSVTGLLIPDLPDTSDTSESKSIDKQAVKSTVRKLLNWVDESIMVIGKGPTKQAIAMYVRAGDVSSEMREALLRLVDSSHVKPAEEKAGIRQIIDTLGDLNDILDHHTPEYLNQVMGFITEVNFG